MKFQTIMGYIKMRGIQLDHAKEFTLASKDAINLVWSPCQEEKAKRQFLLEKSFAERPPSSFAK